MADVNAEQGASVTTLPTMYGTMLALRYSGALPFSGGPLDTGLHKAARRIGEKRKIHSDDYSALS